jgi:hypothetical protein
LTLRAGKFPLETINNKGGYGMLSLDDGVWKTLKGGYGIPYNPVEIITILESDPESIEGWELVWNELHHQGDIGDASFAVVPYLVDIHKRKHFVDWQIYSFVSLIIQESHRKTNPQVPSWIQEDFTQSLTFLFDLAIEQLRTEKDGLIIRSILGFICLQKGLLKYGALLSSFDESEIMEYIDETLDWKNAYE